ncbi:TadE family protein [Microbacterium sp. B2969]|uniref:TadE family protein n=1 Tax=Microbacterium alkaliflavum TaxID=3248839 RepID=A0ABW7Q631_9MICO
MRRSNRSTESLADDPERGSAALEFILVGMLLLVPLVYLVVALGLIQSQALGAEAGARHIARVISTAADESDARTRADLVLESVVTEYGMDAASVNLSLTCRPTGSGCPAPGAMLVVTLRTRIPLPLVPPVLGLDRLASIPVEATSLQKVSRFWSAE